MRRSKRSRGRQPANVKGPTVKGDGNANIGDDVKAGLPATGAGNRRVDCDERRGSGGRPMTEVIGDGKTY